MKLIDKFVKLNNQRHSATSESSLANEDCNRHQYSMKSSLSSVSSINLMPIISQHDDETTEISDISQQQKQPIALIQFQNQQFQLRKSYFMVGRKSKFFNKCDLNIEKSNYVSRIHFIIELDTAKRQFFIYCISKNGIFINNKHLQRDTPMMLDNKCTLRFPDTSLKVYFESCLDKTPSEQPLNENSNLKCINTIKAFIKTTSNSEVNAGNTEVANDDTVTTMLANSSNKTNDSFSSNNSNDNSLSNELMMDEDSQGSNNSNKNMNGDGVNKKPAYSYAQLIAQAILSTNERQLTLNQIYMFISKNYPYYKLNDKGWQNSIRHNLSLNRYFVKIARQQNEPGKGSFWRIEEKSEAKVVEQAYQRKRSRSVTNVDKNGEKNTNNEPEPQLFSPMSVKNDSTRENDADLSAATSPSADNNSRPFTPTFNENSQQKPQNKLIKLLQPDASFSTDFTRQQQQDFSTNAPQALLTYLYQVNTSNSNTKNSSDLATTTTTVAKNEQNQLVPSSNNDASINAAATTLQSLFKNNTAFVLQCNLPQFATSSAKQNLTIIPYTTIANTATSGDTVDAAGNHSNSTKLRYLLNSDILTPINTANLLNACENSSNSNMNANSMNKHSLDDSSDENNNNNNNNSENISKSNNKKQKLDTSSPGGIIN